MVPNILSLILTLAVLLTLALGLTGAPRRSTPMLVAAALLVVTAAAFAFSALALA